MPPGRQAGTQSGCAALRVGPDSHGATLEEPTGQATSSTLTQLGLKHGLWPVLDLWHMDFLERGRGMEGYKASSARYRPGSCATRVRQLGFLFLISSLTTALCAQQP